MTDHGMMRFDENPWAAHGLKAPKIDEIIRRWAAKNRDIAKVEESVLQATGVIEFLIQPVSAEIDQHFKIHTLHNIRQSVWHDASGCRMRCQIFPPFITEPELAAVLETIFNLFNPKNKDRTKK